MTHNAQSIEEIFTRKARIRAGKHIQGDGGYWAGGRCEWGGAHNLREDCQTLAKFFDDTTELKNAQKDLINFNSREEFDKNKKDLLAKTTQAINGLSVSTGSSTYVGGVCIIWKDFSEFLDSIIGDFRKEIESLKGDIENAQYEEAQELALIEQKEGELKQEIEENERKAASETDPDKKRKFIFLADQAKNEWKKLLEQKKKLKIANLGNNFNPDKHINDFIKAIKDSLGDGNTPKKDPFKDDDDPDAPPKPKGIITCI
jgi:hypothetical protein